MEPVIGVISIHSKRSWRRRRLLCVMLVLAIFICYAAVFRFYCAIGNRFYVGHLLQREVHKSRFYKVVPMDCLTLLPEA